MDNLKSKSLLLITPHFNTFIREQAVILKPFLAETNAVVPTPFLSNLVSHMPFIKKHYAFLRVSGESVKNISDFKLVSPKYLTLPFSPLQKRNSSLVARSCERYVSKNSARFDFIHAHFLNCGFAGSNLKRIYNKPLIVTTHGGDFYDLPFKDSRYNAVARFVLNSADQVITVSKWYQEKLLSLGANANKLCVIPNGYNPNLFKPMSLSEARRLVGLPADKKVLLSVGNLVDVKGHSFLLDAMTSVSKQQSDILLVIIGSGPLSESLRRKTRKLELEKNVMFVGGKKHIEIPIWMNASDVFIMPSLKESFGVVLIESLACGKPVVGTRVGGIPEIISQDNVGIKVEPANPSCLADGILSALNKRWSQSEILNFASQYSWNKIINKILAVYRKVI